MFPPQNYSLKSKVILMSLFWMSLTFPCIQDKRKKMFKDIDNWQCLIKVA